MRSRRASTQSRDRKARPLLRCQRNSNFSSVLQNATQLDPSGQAVRPLGVASYTQQIQQSAQKYGLDPKLIQSVMQVESDGNPNSVSRAGALGLMQLMPSNIQEAGVTNPFDPTQNIDAGAKQLSSALSEFGGNLDLALAAYNAGSGAVKKFGGIPPYAETQNYVRKVRALMDQAVQPAE